MGWNWRSSKNFGGLRLNLSSRGIGWSAGVKGFRIGRDAHGRSYSHTSIPGTGLYNRSYHSKSSNKFSTNNFRENELAPCLHDEPEINYETYLNGHKLFDEVDPSLEKLKQIWATGFLLGAVSLFILGINWAGFIVLAISLVMMSNIKEAGQTLKEQGRFDPEVIAQFDQKQKISYKEIVEFLKDLNEDQLLVIIINRIEELSNVALKSNLIYEKVIGPLRSVAHNSSIENLEKWFVHMCWFAILSARNDRLTEHLPKSKDTDRVNDLLANMGASSGVRYAERAILPLLEITESESLKESIFYIMGMVYFHAGNFEEARKFFEKSIKLNGANRQSSEEVLKVCDPKIKKEHRLDYVDYVNLGYEEWFSLKKEEKLKFLEKHQFRIDLEAIDAEIICEISEMLGKISKEESEKISSHIYTGNIIASQPAGLPREKRKTTSLNKQIKESPHSSNHAQQELESLTGLHEIKDEVKKLLDFVSVNEKRKQQGLPEVGLSLHSVFYGPPGTGKTTVARIIGKALKEMGILQKGHIIEVDRAGLVGGYLGQTALKTKEVLEKSLDGVLFIDEAYSLSSEDDSYGKEAIDTILKYMEDNRGRIVVIVAGYNEEMTKFINSNPGLKSRFNNFFQFKNYSENELYTILENLFLLNKFELENGAKLKCISIIKEALQSEEKNFGNARFVRNLYEKTIQNQFSRISNINTPSKFDLCKITPDDFQAMNTIHQEKKAS